MLPDRGAIYRSAPLNDLIALLLRQLRRPLEAVGVAVADADADAVATALLSGQAEMTLLDGLRGLIADGQSVLAGFGLESFQEAIETPMDRVRGWETTADFLHIAAEKTNAETKIAAAIILLVASGDRVYLADFQAIAARATDEPDVLIAKRLADRLARS